MVKFIYTVKLAGKCQSNAVNFQQTGSKQNFLYDETPTRQPSVRQNPSIQRPSMFIKILQYVYSQCVITKWQNLSSTDLS